MKRILLFSTLSPWPFWAGSETYWFDLVTDPRTSKEFEFHIRLADSPVTREKGALLRAAGANVEFYKHYNVEFLRRNVARVRDRLVRAEARTLPWYNDISKGRWDLVWFGVDGLQNVGELKYAITLCKKTGVPYWLQLQQAHEDFFLHDERELSSYTDICVSARRAVFIAERNRRSLERAIGRRLDNAFHSQNALPKRKFVQALKVANEFPVRADEPARFYNLGRFSPKDKGQHLLLEALSDSRWKEREWQLAFIGISGFGETYLRKLAAHFGISAELIKIIPYTTDVFAEIGKQDVLLMPSLAEGTPYAMIESMACARPAMGTPVGGIPELIKNGVTGWLARTTAVADVADALERMWAERAHWLTLGAKAREHVEAQNNEETVYTGLIDALRADVA